MAATQRDPVGEIADELTAAWGDMKHTRRVIWPLTLRMGINAIPRPRKE